MSNENTNQFEFEKVEGGYAVKKYRGDKENVVIPDKFQGKPVVEIKCNAFSGCSSIQEMTLPASLRKVEIYGIDHCDSLRKVICHSENVIFDDFNFWLCHEIEEMSVSPWVQGFSHFQTDQKVLKHYQNNWDTLTATDKQNIIDYLSTGSHRKDRIFEEGAVPLISFFLKEGVLLTLDELHDYLEQSIAENNTIMTATFLDYKREHYSLEKLESYETHRQLLEIGLESPDFGEFRRKWLPSEGEEDEGDLKIIRYIGRKKEAIMPSSLADGRKIVGTFHDLNGAYKPLEKLIFSEGIRSLDEETFCYSTTLEEVILPDSLESMGIGCFQYCESLKSIRIPPNIKELPKDCFSDCSALEKVTLPEGLCTIHDYAFAECKNLNEITLPQTLKELKQGKKHMVEPFRFSDDYGIFFGTGIQTITIPPLVKSIPDFAFFSCSDLKEVILHENITNIGKGAFKYTPLLADKQGFVIINNIFFDVIREDPVCVVPSDVKRISCKAFCATKFEEIILPDGLLEIDERGFLDCTHLKKITIPSSVKVLVEDAFTECTLLEEVIVSSSTTVEEGALNNCPLAKIIVK